MTSVEETESNTEREDSNQIFAKNLQEKEDIIETTSKEQEGESTQTEFDTAFIDFSLFESNLFLIALQISQNHEGYQQMDLVTQVFSLIANWVYPIPTPVKGQKGLSSFFP